MELETTQADFWQDQHHATAVSQRIAEIKEDIEIVELLKKESQDVKELRVLAENDETLSQELEKACQSLQKNIEKEEFVVFLSGPYDKKNALLEIFSGAGGQDAQDWATMLLRMYQRYCQKKGFGAEVLRQSLGEGGGPDGRIGTKNVTIEITGKYAYGFLKQEAGVHRLVRISPFNSQQLRHTSFALVEVLPVLDEGEADIEIKPEDLKLETFKASGPGGQYVNKTESAVRITHIPTGIVVACQTERMQGKNRDRAMKILYAKLLQLKKQTQEKTLKEIKGDAVSASWGNQIRSYVLHPYQMVKDLRTQVETSQTDKVLDGDLGEFIHAELKLEL